VASAAVAAASKGMATVVPEAEPEGGMEMLATVAAEVEVEDDVIVTRASQASCCKPYPPWSRHAGRS
jgi:hypothetical protein